MGLHCFKKNVLSTSFQNICQMKMFVIVYQPKECLLSVSVCEVSKTLRIFKKPYFLNQMQILHNYTQKSIISRRISPWP